MMCAAKVACADVHIADTLHIMAGVYALTREGGPKSPRFAAYVSQTREHWGIVPYNPMAGDAALETVNALIVLDAESIAVRAAQDVANECQYAGEITLALAVRSTGLWTDRVATEVDERVTGKPRTPHRGVISIWSREESSASDVAREAAAEAVRIMWHAQHGSADTLTRVLACEGIAYALAERQGTSSRYDMPAAPEETVAVMEAFDVLGDTTQASEIAGVMYGDETARAMGWTPLGLAKYAGYRWALARAKKHIAAVGAPDALRASVLP